MKLFKNKKAEGTDYFAALEEMSEIAAEEAPEKQRRDEKRRQRGADGRPRHAEARAGQKDRHAEELRVPRRIDQKEIEAGKLSFDTYFTFQF